MCVIVYKPAGKDLPARWNLENCFENNADGAGFMYPIPSKNKVKIRKGFFSFENFMDAVSSIENVRELPLVMHFRIGTQGLIDKGNCHPFPVSGSTEALTSESSIANVGLAHNGIIPLTTSWSSKTYKTDNKEQRSDTYYFVRDYARLIVDDNIKWYEQRNLVVLMYALAESKLAVMSGDGHVELMGEFEDYKDGCLYSNSSHKYVWASSTYYGSTTKYLPSSTHSGTPLYPREGYWDEEDFELDKKLFGANKDPWDNVMVKETIEAQFVPSGVGIIEWSTGKIINSDDDLFLFDMNAQVYLYDSTQNAAIIMEECTAVDEELDLVIPDGKALQIFALKTKE